MRCLVPELEEAACCIPSSIPLILVVLSATLKVGTFSLRMMDGSKTLLSEKEEIGK